MKMGELKSVSSTGKSVEKIYSIGTPFPVEGVPIRTGTRGMSPSKKHIPTKELISLLKKWKNNRNHLGDVASRENLDCAKDIEKLLKERGWKIDPKLCEDN